MKKVLLSLVLVIGLAGVVSAHEIGGIMDYGTFDLTKSGTQFVYSAPTSEVIIANDHGSSPVYVSFTDVTPSGTTALEIKAGETLTFGIVTNAVSLTTSGATGTHGRVMSSRQR